MIVAAAGSRLSSSTSWSLIRRTSSTVPRTMSPSNMASPSTTTYSTALALNVFPGIRAVPVLTSSGELCSGASRCMENPSFVRLAEMVAVGLYSSSSAGAFKPASSELLGHAHGSSDGRFSSGDWGTRSSSSYASCRRCRDTIEVASTDARLSANTPCERLSDRYEGVPQLPERPRAARPHTVGREGIEPLALHPTDADAFDELALEGKEHGDHR